MKICVIGNSHVSAIKLAYDQMEPDASTPKLTFFADRGPCIDYLVVQNGMLGAEKHNPHLRSALQFTSGGLSEIDPDAYDRFLIIGLAENIGQLVPVLHRPISNSARNCALYDFWEASSISKMLEKLLSITDKPISYGLTPLPAAPKKDENGAEAYEQMIALSEDLYFRSKNVALVGQPSETIVNGRNTKHVFAQGSVRLRVNERLDTEPHPEGETIHMNSGFGAIWLKAFLSNL